MINDIQQPSPPLPICDPLVPTIILFYHDLTPICLFLPVHKLQEVLCVLHLKAALGGRGAAAEEPTSPLANS